MINIPNIFKKGAFQLGASLLMAMLQLFQIGVISRGFSGADLGVVAVHTLLSSFILVLSDFGLQNYVIQYRGDRSSLISSMSKSFYRFSTILCILLIFVGTGFYITGYDKNIAYACFIVVPLLPFMVLFGPIQGIIIKEGNIGRLATTELVGKAAGSLTVAITAFFFHFIFCILAGLYATVLVKFLMFYKIERKDLLTLLKRQSGKESNSDVYSYTGAQVMGQVVNVLGGRADEIIVAAAVPLAAFGIYATTKQIVIQAVAFISPAIRRLTMPVFSEHRLDDGSLTAKSSRFFFWSDTFYLLFFLGIALAPDLVVHLILGRQFSGGASLLSAFAVMWAVRTYAGGTISAFFQSTGAPMLDLFWASFQIIVQLAVMKISIGHGLIPMIMCSSAAYALLGLGAHCVIFKRASEIRLGAKIMYTGLPVLFLLVFAAAYKISQLANLQTIMQIVAAAIFVSISLTSAKFLTKKL